MRRNEKSANVIIKLKIVAFLQLKDEGKSRMPCLAPGYVRSIRALVRAAIRASATTASLGARSFAVGAICLGAAGVEAKGVVGDGKAFGFGNRVLAFFDFGVVKLFDLAAVQADQMVVVFALVQLEHRLAAFKLAALQNAGLLKLHKHAVHRGQAHIGAFLEQHPKDVFGRHMALQAALEDFQYLQTRQRGLEAGAFEFVDIAHA